MTEINHAIGAEGIVSAECKEVVAQYGDLIWDLLISGVGCFYIYFFLYSVYISRFTSQHKIFIDLQVRPDKICSEIGVCLFNGARYARSGVIIAS